MQRRFDRLLFFLFLFFLTAVVLAVSYFFVNVVLSLLLFPLFLHVLPLPLLDATVSSKPSTINKSFEQYSNNVKQSLVLGELVVWN